MQLLDQGEPSLLHGIEQRGPPSGSVTFKLGTSTNLTRVNDRKGKKKQKKKKKGSDTKQAEERERDEQEKEEGSQQKTKESTKMRATKDNEYTSVRSSSESLSKAGGEATV